MRAGDCFHRGWKKKKQVEDDDDWRRARVAEMAGHVSLPVSLFFPYKCGPVLLTAASKRDE